MNQKLLLILLFVSSLFGYLEWSGGQHGFIFQLEADLAKKFGSEPLAFLHPAILLPLTGQLLLLLLIFQKKPGRMLVRIAVILLSTIFLLLLLIGIIEPNFKMIASTIPFFVLAVLVFISLRRKKKADS